METKEWAVVGVAIPLYEFNRGEPPPQLKILKPSTINRHLILAKGGEKKLRLDFDGDILYLVL